MKILVVLRLVPDGEIEIAANGREIDREWIDMRLNDFDDHALEQAVLLKEACGAKVIAAAPLVDGIHRTLQTAIARGADEVATIAHSFGEEPCSRDLCTAIAATAMQLGADLVLTGVQAPNDLFGQLAPSLGGLLDWPVVSGVSGAKSAGDAVEVVQEQGSGRSLRLSVKLPAVLGIQAAAQAPRYVSGSKLRQAVGFTVTAFGSTDEALTNASTLLNLERPPENGSAMMFSGEPEEVASGLVNVLKERGLLNGRHA
jgi:electron transfer flavoprotein beta subunit